jgi:dipeptidyl aminopeptidase/acylaminoacyl peptidase
VVPPNQAVMMHEALAKRGVPTALVMFAGEQHGFRSAPNIRAAVDGEMYFYGKVLGFHAEMPEGLPVMEIQNLPKA